MYFFSKINGWGREKDCEDNVINYFFRFKQDKGNRHGLRNSEKNIHFH